MDKDLIGVSESIESDVSDIKEEIRALSDRLEDHVYGMNEMTIRGLREENALLYSKVEELKLELQKLKTPCLMKKD